jgi:hypothetical protein
MREDAMKSIALLIALSSPAMAQTAWSVTGGQGAICYMQGLEFPARNGICFAEDMKYGLPVTSVITGSIVTGSIASSSITSSTAKCPDGYSLVNVGRPMCAKDLIEPTW